MNIEAARAQMLGQQIRAWEVLDDRVLDVLARTPRELFVPDHYRELAFADMEIPLAHAQRMMPPKIEGRLLQSLQLEPSDGVLEVGTGSGYLTACLARLTRHVLSVDIFEDFTAGAAEKLAQQGIENVTLETRDALKLEAPAQFDAIAVTGSVPMLTPHFVSMLRPGGRLFIVVGRAPAMEALLITRHSAHESTEQSLFETVLPPLINAEQPVPFVL